MSRWRDQVFAVRDRLLASPRFQQLAGAFPLTRPIARRRAAELFDLCAGFVYSQVLVAGVRLKLFDVLAEGPQDLGVLAKRLDLAEDRAARLLEAAVVLRLAARRGPQRYGLGELGAALLGQPAVAAMIDHHAVLYGDLADPVALLRGKPGATALARYWATNASVPAVDAGASAVADYSVLMSVSQPLVADEILNAYKVGGHHCVLDVGGGEGTFLSAVAARAPHLKLMLFDLPAVADRARVRFAEAGLSARATAVGGNAFVDRLPEGADLISLVRVVHDHDDPAVMTLFQSIRRALPVGGVLLIAEPMADAPGAERMGAAYFGFYLLAMGRGRPRTLAELTALLQAAGFRDVRRIATRIPLQTSVVIAFA